MGGPEATFNGWLHAGRSGSCKRCGLRQKSDRKSDQKKRSPRLEIDRDLHLMGCATESELTSEISSRWYNFMRIKH